MLRRTTPIAKSSGIGFENILLSRIIYETIQRQTTSGWLVESMVRLKLPLWFFMCCIHLKIPIWLLSWGSLKVLNHEWFSFHWCSSWLFWKEMSIYPPRLIYSKFLWYIKPTIALLSGNRFGNQHQCISNFRNLQTPFSVVAETTSFNGVWFTFPGEMTIWKK